VIANGLAYRPRPSFQAYATYTRRLIDENRRSLTERGPEWLLVEPESVDGRHPAMSEGALWPDIARLYEPHSLVDGLLVVHRRREPLDDVLGSVSHEDGDLGGNEPRCR